MTPNEFRREFMSTTRAMQNSVHKTMRPICQDHGLTIQQLIVLTELADGAGQTAGQISDRVGILRTNLAPVCRKLEEKGLVEKMRHSEDGRAVAIHITGRGSALLASIDDTVDARFTEAFAAEPKETFDDIIRGLHLLRSFTEKLA